MNVEMNHIGIRIDLDSFNIELNFKSNLSSQIWDKLSIIGL